MGAANPEVNAKNILAINEYSKVTRKLLREVQINIISLDTQIQGLKEENFKLQEQLRALQVKIYSGGATSGNNN